MTCVFRLGWKSWRSLDNWTHTLLTCIHSLFVQLPRNPSKNKMVQLTDDYVTPLRDPYTDFNLHKTDINCTGKTTVCGSSPTIWRIHNFFSVTMPIIQMAFGPIIGVAAVWLACDHLGLISLGNRSTLTSVRRRQAALVCICLPLCHHTNMDRRQLYSLL